jgi:protoheme IX farnesyltransferase
LILGIALNILAFAILFALANLLAASLALLGTLLYVFVYTIWLKRSTPQNIVIGGAAGAIPPLVGWAAVTGSLDLTALALFAVIFLWTPPHFWSLAQMLKSDYSAAGVPMLPVVADARTVKLESLAYALPLVLVSTVPFVTGAAGPAYLVGVLGLGLVYVGLLAVDLIRGHLAGRLFAYSIVYLGGVFGLLALAPLMGQ